MRGSQVVYAAPGHAVDAHTRGDIRVGSDRFAYRVKSPSVATSILLMIEVAMDYYALVTWRFDAPNPVRLTDCLAHTRSCRTLADTGRHAELIRRPHPRQFTL